MDNCNFYLYLEVSVAIATGNIIQRLHLSSRLLFKNLKDQDTEPILGVVVYGCETWSLTSREKHRIRIFVNRVLRRIFGSKKEEVVGDWRRLHNEELHNLYYASPNVIRMMKSRRMRLAGHVARMVAITAFNIFGKPEGNIDHSEDLSVDGKIILECVLGK
jgi:hypothetical protein